MADIERVRDASYMLPSGKRKRWRVIDYLAVIPLGIVVLLSEGIPWFRQQGLTKLFATFMVLWCVIGFASISMDSGPDRRFEYTTTVNPDRHYTVAWARDCAPDRTFGQGGLPFGGVYLTLVNCSSYLAGSMLQSLHVTAGTRWIAGLKESANLGYAYGTFSGKYIILGAVAFASLFLLPLWLIYLLFIAIAFHIRFSWK